MAPQEHRTLFYKSYVTSGQAARSDDLKAILSLRGPYLRELVAAHFPLDRSAKVLDIGCGYGALLHFIREAGYCDSAGIDTSAEQVALARSLGLDRVEEGDIVAHIRNVAEATYDVVVAFDVLEHFTRSEVLDLLGSIKRIVKPGGKIIAHVPNGSSPFVGSVLYGDFTHELAFTEQSLQQVATALGFVQIRCYEDRPVPHGLKSKIRSILWRLLRLCFRFIDTVETGASNPDALYSRNILAVIDR